MKRWRNLTYYTVTNGNNQPTTQNKVRVTWQHPIESVLEPVFFAIIGNQSENLKTCRQGISAGALNVRKSIRASTGLVLFILFLLSVAFWFPSFVAEGSALVNCVREPYDRQNLYWRWSRSSLSWIIKHCWTIELFQILIFRFSSTSETFRLRERKQSVLGEMALSSRARPSMYDENTIHAGMWQRLFTTLTNHIFLWKATCTCGNVVFLAVILRFLLVSWLIPVSWFMPISWISLSTIIQWACRRSKQFVVGIIVQYN